MSAHTAGAGLSDEPDFEQIAGMLDAYVESIKEHGGAMLDRWHYIPQVEHAAESLRAMLAISAPFGESAVERLRLAIYRIMGGDIEPTFKEAEAIAEEVDRTRGTLAAPLVKAKPKCTKCGGSGVVDDGEIDCYEDGTPYKNGPIKCVKDCPACKGRPAAHGAVDTEPTPFTIWWDENEHLLMDRGYSHQDFAMFGFHAALAAPEPLPWPENDLRLSIANLEDMVRRNAAIAAPAVPKAEKVGDDLPPFGISVCDDGVMVFGYTVEQMLAYRAPTAQNTNAPWLTQAHMLCTDQGIAQGDISDRIAALRDKLEAAQSADAYNCGASGCCGKGIPTGVEHEGIREMMCGNEPAAQSADAADALGDLVREVGKLNVALDHNILLRESWIRAKKAIDKSTGGPS